MKAFAIAATLTATLGLTAGSASAFVRSRTDKGTPIFWPGSCAWIQPDAAGSTDLPLPTVLQIVAKGVANWQSVTLQASPPCSYLTLLLDPPIPSEARLDHINVVKFRSDKWCRPAEGSTAEMCYSPEATAITTIFYDSDPGKSTDGNIVDADIELNEINFTFIWIDHLAPPTRANTMKADLENTLTHEIGHLQGLDHTCWDHVSATDPVDNTGAPIPDCTAVQMHEVDDATYLRITQSSMYNFALPTETVKRMPKADDIAGICSIYPVAQDPKSCTRPPPVGKGCAIALGRSDATSSGFGLAALAVLAMLRRRRAVVAAVAVVAVGRRRRGSGPAQSTP